MSDRRGGRGSGRSKGTPGPKGARGGPARDGRGPSGGGRPVPADLALPPAVVRELRGQVRGRRGDDAINALDSAVRFLEKGVAGKAIVEATKAKELAPRSGAVREVLALALYKAERYKETATEVQAYRRLTGREDQNHIAADSYRALGQRDKAVTLATEELRSDAPAAARAEAAIVGASALADEGRTDEALALLRRFRTQPDAARPFDLRVWYVTGDILEKAGRTDAAEEAFRQVLRHDAAAFDVAERLAQLTDG